MSEAIKPTPGPWRIDTFLGCLTGADSKVIGGHADLTLCAEAGTVFHETQCTPRQLVERVKELEEALTRAQQAINSMKVEAETAAQGDEQMMLEACETISNEGLYADMEIWDALAKALPNADAKEAGK